MAPHRLLELLSPYAPDDFLAGIYPGDFRGGRRPGVSAGQLRRTHLLAVWTATHSLNLVVASLPEPPAWRRFALSGRAGPPLPVSGATVAKCSWIVQYIIA